MPSAIRRFDPFGRRIELALTVSLAFIALGTAVTLLGGFPVVALTNSPVVIIAGLAIGFTGATLAFASFAVFAVREAVRGRASRGRGKPDGESWGQHSYRGHGNM